MGKGAISYINSLKLPLNLMLYYYACVTQNKPTNSEQVSSLGLGHSSFIPVALRVSLMPLDFY